MNKIFFFIVTFTLGFFFATFFLISYIEAEQSLLVNVSNTNGESYHPQLLVSDNTVYTVWTDNSTGNDETFFAESMNGGISFSEPLNLSGNEGSSQFPRLHVLRNNIFVTWYDYSPGKSDILFSKSSDNGASFDTVNISDNPGASFNPWVAGHENNIYVLWNDETPNLSGIQIETQDFDLAITGFDILLATSHDGGSTFKVSNLSNSKSNSVGPRITVKENNVYVVWTERTSNGNEIFFTMSKDNGNSFIEPINVSKSGKGSTNAGIQVFGNNVYIVWQESKKSGSSIFFSLIENDETSINTPIDLSKESGKARLTRDKNMAVLGNHVYVVWYDVSSKNSGVYFVQSTDGGKTFSQPLNLSGKVPEVAKAQILANGEKVFVIWQDKRAGNAEVFLRQSNDNGATFGSIINISQDDVDSTLSILGPQISASEDNVYVIFEKESSLGKDLFLRVLEQDQKSSEVLTLQTINGAVTIEMGIDTKIIEPEMPVTFTLKFLDPLTGQQLKDVNYSFKIDDVEGNNLVNMLNQHTETGFDTQTVTFQKKGSVNIVIEVEGKEPPYDIQFAGTASAIITVVPEFPIGVLGILAIVLVMGLLLSKFSLFKNLSHKNSNLQS